jgi:hypothetical protein
MLLLDGRCETLITFARESIEDYCMRLDCMRSISTTDRGIYITLNTSDIVRKILKRFLVVNRKDAKILQHICSRIHQHHSG